MKSRLAILAPLAFAVSVSSAFAADYDAPQPGPQLEPAYRLEAGLGWSELSGGGSLDAFDAVGAGSAAFAFDAFHVQFDVFARHEDFGSGTNGGKITNAGLGAHFGWRDENTGMYGLNIAYNNLKVSGASAIKAVRIGGEGEIFMNNTTFGASAGYVNLDTSGASSIDAFYLKGLVRHYVNDNFKVEGALGILDPEGTGEGIYSNAMAEYRFTDSPVSLFARWNGLFISPGNAEAHQLLAGVKIALGGSKHGTIKSSDRRYFADSCLFESSAVPVC